MAYIYMDNAEAARNNVRDDAVAFLQIRSTTLFNSVMALYFLFLFKIPHHGPFWYTVLLRMSDTGRAVIHG